MTHICVDKLTIIGSDNGLSPGRHQAITWANVGILLIGPLGTNLSKILIEILTFSFKKMRLKVLSAKWRPYCLGLYTLSMQTRSSLILCLHFAYTYIDMCKIFVYCTKTFFCYISWNVSDFLSGFYYNSCHLNGSNSISVFSVRRNIRDTFFACRNSFNYFCHNFCQAYRYSTQLGNA